MMSIRTCIGPQFVLGAMECTHIHISTSEAFEMSIMAPYSSVPCLRVRPDIDQRCCRDGGNGDRVGKQLKSAAKPWLGVVIARGFGAASESTLTHNSSRLVLILTNTMPFRACSCTHRLCACNRQWCRTYIRCPLEAALAIERWKA